MTMTNTVPTIAPDVFPPNHRRTRRESSVTAPKTRVAHPAKIAITTNATSPDDPLLAWLNMELAREKTMTAMGVPTTETSAICPGVEFAAADFRPNDGRKRSVSNLRRNQAATGTRNGNIAHTIVRSKLAMTIPNRAGPTSVSPRPFTPNPPAYAHSNATRHSATNNGVGPSPIPSPPYKPTGPIVPVTTRGPTTRLVQALDYRTRTDHDVANRPCGCARFHGPDGLEPLLTRLAGPLLDRR